MKINQEKLISPKNKTLRPPIKYEKEANFIEISNEKYIKKYDQDSYDSSTLKNDIYLKIFQDLMNSKYIEMINFHKKEILNYIIKDTERQRQIMNLLEEIASFTKANLLLEQENKKITKIIKENAKNN